MAGTATIRSTSTTKDISDVIIPDHATAVGTDQDSRPDVMVSTKVQGGNEISHTNNHTQQYRSIISAGYPRSSSSMTTGSKVLHTSHYQVQNGMMMLPTMHSSSGDLNRNMMSSLDHQALVTSPGITRFPPTLSGGLADQHQHHQDAFTTFPTNLVANGRSMSSEAPLSMQNPQSSYQLHSHNNMGTSYSISAHRYGYPYTTLAHGMNFPASPFHSPLALTDLSISQPDTQYIKHLSDTECCSHPSLIQTIPISDESGQQNIASSRDQINQGWMMMYADTIDGQFYCRICPNSRLFNSKATLKKHIQYCHAEKPQCPYCKAGIRADNMSRHIKRYCPKAGYKNTMGSIPQRGQQPRYSMDVLKGTGTLESKTSDTTIIPQTSGLYPQDTWDDHKGRIDKVHMVQPIIPHEKIDTVSLRRGSGTSNTEEHGCDTSLVTLSFLAADREKNSSESDSQNKIDQNQESSVILPSIRRGDGVRTDASGFNDDETKSNASGYSSSQYIPTLNVNNDSESLSETTLLSRYAQLSNSSAMTAIQNRQISDYYQQQFRNTHGSASSQSSLLSKGNDPNVSLPLYPQHYAVDQGQLQNWGNRGDPRSIPFTAQYPISSHSDLLNSPMNLPPLFQLSISPNSSYDNQHGGLSSWTASGPSQLSNVVTLSAGTTNRQSSNASVEFGVNPSISMPYQQYISHPPTTMPRYTMKPSMDFIPALVQQNVERPDQSSIMFDQRSMARSNANGAAISREGP